MALEFRDKQNPFYYISCTIAALWVGLFTLEFLHPHFFLDGDNASSYIASYLHASRTLFETGQLAEINYYQYGGQPFIEQAQSGVLYPPTYIGYLLAKWINGDLRWIVEWLIAFHFSFGVLGLWLWLRKAGIHPALASFGSLIWVFSPFTLFLTASWMIVANVVCYLPWFFLALDKLIAKPSALSALFLGLVTGLCFLGGTVQWMSYAALFAILYLCLTLRHASFGHWVKIVIYGTLAVNIFFVLTLPLILPVQFATSISVQRSMPLSLPLALARSINLVEFLIAQVADFKPREIPTYIPRTLRTLPSVIFSSPEIFCLPYLIISIFRIRSASRLRKLLTFSLLTFLALCFSTKLHVILSLLPVFNRFRWPFKVFLFFKFFFLVALLFAFNETLREKTRLWLNPLRIMLAILGVVAIEGAATSYLYFDSGMLNECHLASLEHAFPPEVDATRGRAVSMGVFFGVSTNYDRYLAFNYGTTYQIPNIGGYDPLVAPAQSIFAFNLNEANLFDIYVSRKIRAELNSRAVRYFILKTEKYDGLNPDGFGDTRIIESLPDRVIYENLLAEPLAMSGTGEELPLSYHGNSVIVQLQGKGDKVGVSLSDTVDWWYRTDHSAWKQPTYDHDRVWCPVAAGDKTLEIRYFSRSFHYGLEMSSLLLVLIVLTIPLFRRI